MITQFKNFLCISLRSLSNPPHRKNKPIWVWFWKEKNRWSKMGVGYLKSHALSSCYTVTDVRVTSRSVLKRSSILYFCIKFYTDQDWVRHLDGMSRKQEQEKFSFKSWLETISILYNWKIWYSMNFELRRVQFCTLQIYSLPLLGEVFATKLTASL